MDVWLKSIEVIRYDGKWHVVNHYSSGEPVELRSTRLKRDAVNTAVGVALIQGPKNKYMGRQLEFVVKGRNGKIQAKTSYGTDPVGNG